MESDRAWELCSIALLDFMKASGKTIIGMAEEWKGTAMEIGTRGSSRTTSHMARASTHG
jgi:hypothetical protein